MDQNDLHSITKSSHTDSSLEVDPFFIHRLWTNLQPVFKSGSIFLARVSWRSEKAKLSMNGINVPSQDPLRVGSDQITTDYEKSSRGDSRESRESRSSSISTLGDSTSLPREYD